MPRVGEKFAYEMSWQEQIGLESLVKPREEPMSDERAQPIRVGDVFTLDGRQMRVLGMSDGVTVCRDRKGRIAARNVETNRLSYVSEHRLSEDRRARVHELKCWPEYFAAIFDGSKTKTAQAREVQEMITAWQDAAASDHAHAQRQAERAELAVAALAAARAEGREVFRRELESETGEVAFTPKQTDKVLEMCKTARVEGEAAGRASEREACARTAEKICRSEPRGVDDGWDADGAKRRRTERIAAAIRARAAGEGQ
jgi:hypothetical protein